MHSYSLAHKSSGAFFRDYAGERCRKRPARVRMALRASQGVRPSTVMLNSAWSDNASEFLHQENRASSSEAGSLASRKTVALES